MEESVALKEFFELVAAVYKRWPQGTIKVSLDIHACARCTQILVLSMLV